MSCVVVDTGREVCMRGELARTPCCRTRGTSHSVLPRNATRDPAPQPPRSQQNAACVPVRRWKINVRIPRLRWKWQNSAFKRQGSTTPPAGGRRRHRVGGGWTRPARGARHTGPGSRQARFGAPVDRAPSAASEGAARAGRAERKRCGWVASPRRGHGRRALQRGGGPCSDWPAAGHKAAVFLSTATHTSHTPGPGSPACGAWPSAAVAGE